MSIEITMPRLSDTMEQGTIVSWSVKEGDSVSAGDVLGDIETDKATMELQSFDDGTVAALLLKEGKSVRVGTAIMVLAEDGEDAASVKAQYADGANASAPAKSEETAAASSGGSDSSSNGASSTAVAEPAHTSNGHGGGRVFASPLAKKVAQERGVNLAGIEGTGPGGRIIQRDVEAAARGGGAVAPMAAPVPMPAPAQPSRGAAPVAATVPGTAFDMGDGPMLQGKTVALSNMRATIARRLVESKTSVPHYQVTVTARMDALLEQREHINEQLKPYGVKLSVNDFVVRACAKAMYQHPYINASWGEYGKSVQFHGEVNVGVAIALPIDQASGEGGGLVVGVLKHADRMGLRQISANTKALAMKARERGLTIDEMSGATFTISNLGMYGVEHFTAIINPPNSAILAVGGAIKKPVVVEKDGVDTIEIGHEMQMTMSSDHRVIDGAMAAQYLATVKQMLEAPMMLLV
ncbi:MAG: 2-oxo acid dehydrogenase subunit E2 [Phycisphaerales bacterium]|nr:2-oxo acid dehydrogenase subunit E2 [Phycisphaerales bacterium]